jgi:hypothetical protein
MSWQPGDLLSDDDLLAYESTLAQTFNRVEWDDKRSLAIEHWMFPILRANGYQPENLRTRYEPDAVWAYTASTFTDDTGDATNETSDDLNLATIFATALTDAIYVGSERAFRGVSWRVLDSPSAVTGTVTVSYWADQWVPIGMTDQTTQGGVLFARGGSMTWRVPSDWVKRPLSTSVSLYYVKVQVSATPTAAKAGQLGVIRRSSLCAPLAFRTLALIMREAPSSGAGPWADKAVWYENEANAALERALRLVSSEIDTDVSDQVSEEETEQTAAEVSNGTFRLERG